MGHGGKGKASMSDDHEHDSVYEEVELEDMDYDEVEEVYTYYCPCGDEFQLYKEDMEDGEDIATCPSCSLIIRVITTRPSLRNNLLMSQPKRRRHSDGIRCLIMQQQYFCNANPINSEHVDHCSKDTINGK